jgi:hypothetical protein
MGIDDVVRLHGSTGEEKPSTLAADEWASYYFGWLAAAEEHLGVSYGPDKTVWAVDGENVERGSHVLLSCGDNSARVFAEFGRSQRRAATGGAAVGYDFDGTVVYMERNQVFDIVLETPQHRAARLKREAAR